MVALLLFGAGCQTTEYAPIRTADYVDLERFMGDWYVLGNIPTVIEREAYNALESYRLEDNGTIDTTFSFNKGSFDGPEKTYHPRGFVRDKETNAVWGMQFVWPIKAEYRVMYVDPDYEQTVIGRRARDYVWIMARKPHLPEADFQRLVELVAAEGYDISNLRRVPQRWD